MADPFSIAATATGLAVTIVKVSKDVEHFMRQVREARREMDAVCRELGSLRSALEMLAGDMDAPGVAVPQTLEDILSNCEEVLGQLESCLKKYNSERLNTRVKYVWSGKETVAGYRAALAAHKGALDLAIDVMTLSLAREIKMTTDETLEATADIKADTEKILEQIAELQSRLPTANEPQAGKTGFLIRKYLDELGSYAGSVIDEHDTPSNSDTVVSDNREPNTSESDPNHGEEHALVHLPLSTEPNDTSDKPTYRIDTLVKQPPAPPVKSSGASQSHIPTGLYHPTLAFGYLRTLHPQEMEELFTAIDHNDHLRVTKALETVTNVNEFRENKQVGLAGGEWVKWDTALHFAARYGRTTIVKILLERGADGNILNTSNETPMVHAVQRHFYNTALKMQQHEMYEHARSNADSYPFQWACASGDIIAVQKLLQQISNLDGEDDWNLTGLHYACLFSHEGIIKLLLGRGASYLVDNQPYKDVQFPDYPWFWPRNFRIGGPWIVYRHIGAALHCACAGGGIGIVQMLIARGAPVNHQSKLHSSPLHIASFYGHLDVVQTLLKAGASCTANEIGLTALHYVSENVQCNVRVIEQLIAAGANVNAVPPSYGTPLHRAVDHDSVDAVRTLLKAGADINNRGFSTGFTPLYGACRLGRERAARILLEAGPDLNQAETLKQRTPLHVACEKGYGEIVAMLADAGARLDEPDKYKKTALHIACEYGQETAVSKLLSRGPNLEHRDGSGKTAFLTACCLGHVDIIRLLVGHGAEITAKDDQGNGYAHCIKLWKTTSRESRSLGPEEGFESGYRCAEYNREREKEISALIRHDKFDLLSTFTGRATITKNQFVSRHGSDIKEDKQKRNILALLSKASN